MPIETNLNINPYFDDYVETNDYYKILFRPGVALQARELTQLQSITQNQIEKFGNHVFKSGTIISGVNFSFNPKYDYAKILDLQVDGQPVVIGNFQDLQVKNSSNLVAKVVNTKAGYETKDPETNYIFLKYLNSGTSGISAAFNAGDILTVFNETYPVFQVNINNGSTGFSNSDSIHFVSALVVANSNLAVGTNISQTIGASTANVYVIESNTTFGSVTVNNITYTNTAGYTVLKVKPLNADLSSGSTTAAKWTITPGYSVVQGSNTATVVANIGSGASATITTDGSGIISDVSMIAQGSGYSITPYVAVKSTVGTISVLDLSAQNYKTQITIADAGYTAGGSTPVGNGYSFSVTDGVIYQKGYFLRVESQTAIVNSYSSNVDSVTVGFTTTETIANSFGDETLLDLATGTPNYAAPGANRLKLTPALSVVNTVDVSSNTTFFPLVEFRDGVPHKQNFATEYGTLSKEFEQRTYEASGSFVVDPFQVASKEQLNYSNNYVDVVLDPGLAYIEGRRVQTLTNSFVQLRRGTDYDTSTNQNISFNYGNYTYVKEMAGFFDAKAGQSIDLYDTARGQITGRYADNIASAGTLIGTARARAVVYDSGIPGTSACRYRLYLFDIRMNQGKTFKDVRSIYSSGSPEGVCDTYLGTDTITGLPVAILNDKSSSTMVFRTGTFGTKTIQNTNYYYATANASANIGTNGVSTITSADEFFYGNNVVLNSVQRRDIILLPAANATSTNTVTSVTINNGASNITVDGAGLTSRFAVGDYVKMQNSSNTAQTAYGQVSSISSSSVMTVADGWTYATISGTGTVARHFPAYVPIPMDDSRVSANTSSDGKTLYVNISNTVGQILFSSLVDAVVYYNSTKISTSQIAKSVARGLKVKIDISTHSASVFGPWCLGVPDAFRLNKVYVGSTSAVNTTNSTDATRFFFLDNGQQDEFYGHAHLNVLNNSSYTPGSSDWLLVEFDAFTLPSPTTAGYFTIDSYPLAQNNSSRASLGNSAINIIEVPEFRNSNGVTVDLRDCIDFRPRLDTSVANVTSIDADASTNPANTIAFGAQDKLFPVPDSVFTYDNSFYLTRVDNIVIDVNNVVRVLEGVSSANAPVPPDTPTHSMSLARVIVPPYPSLPTIPHNNLVEFVLKKTGKDAPVYYKIANYTITQNSSPTISSAQTQRYTMRDIEKIERRVQNLEYYVTLNELEKKTKNLVIPSSVNPTIDRFKNGFFVDNFTDYYLADTAHPEFKACINQVEGTLDPVESTLNIQCKFDTTDTTTRNNLTYGDGSYLEPGLINRRESVITLPVQSTTTIINQGKITSPVNGDGTNTKFIGDLSASPSNFKILLNVEVRLTGADAGPAPAPPEGRGGCKIICTKLAELGYFSPEMNEADQRFGILLQSNDPEAYNGYIRWATPVVQLMEGGGSERLRKIILFWVRDEQKRINIQKSIVIFYMDMLARPWAEEMAYRMGIDIPSNLAGKFLMNIGLPICRLVYKFNGSNKLPFALKTLCIWGSVTVLLLIATPLSLVSKISKKIKSLFSKAK